MAVHPDAVTDSTFDETVISGSNSKPVLVDFWATWCGPCKMLSPLVEQIAEEQSTNLKVVKVDVDENNGVASRYGVMSIPTLILFKEGKPVKQIVGYMPKERIMAQLGDYLKK